MIEYKVIAEFSDLKDGRHVYRVGDKFPRTGVDVSEERVAELASDRNKVGKPLIQAVEPPQKAEKAVLSEDNAVADNSDSKPAKTAKKRNKKVK